MLRRSFRFQDGRIDFFCTSTRYQTNVLGRFTFEKNPTDRLSDRCNPTFLTNDASQRPAGWRRKLVDGLVRFNLDQDLIFLYVVTYGRQPTTDRAFGHHHSELGHRNRYGHSWPAPARY